MSNPKIWDPNLTFNAVPGSLNLDTLALYVSQSINGVMGGAEAPVSPIVIGGAGLDVPGPFSSSGATDITINGTLGIAVGATIQLGGNMVANSASIVQWQSGSFLNLSAGATATLSGTTNASGTINASGAVNLSGTPALTGATVLGVSPARSYPRTCKSVLEVDTSKWAPDSLNPYSFPLIALEGAFISPGSVPDMLAFAADIADGSTITTVSVQVQGNTPAHLPTDRPTLYLYRCDVTTGTETLIGSAIDGSATGAAYVALHAITISGLSEVVNGATSVYVVRVEGEGSVGGVLGLKVCAPTVTSTRAKIGEE
jgi:hypothetical protein